MIGVTTKSRSTGRGLGEIGNGAKDVGTFVPAASTNGYFIGFGWYEAPGFLALFLFYHFGCFFYNYKKIMAIKH